MKRISTVLILIIIILNGCAGMKTSNQSTEQDTNEKYDPKYYAPIQEYTGEGYKLDGAQKETGEIANENREEVEEAVQEFFHDEYKTEVKIHNLVNAVDAVSVFVESVGEPHFYTYAVVPVDIKNKQVATDKVWSEEGQVEDAIAEGLYVMAYKEEFKHLDESLNQFSEEFSLLGTPKDVYEKVKGNGYTNQYYFISTKDVVFDELVAEYLQRPNVGESEIVQY